MKIGTILFTYHRSKHTSAVIEALSQNDVLPEKLYVFQDGMNEKTNYTEWQNVNQLIKNIDFCETQIHVSDVNKGCRRSIVFGINYVLQECDAVIVLEDDCVPGNQFMKFMVSALETYKNEDKVYSVSGYAWNIDLFEQQGDAYFNGRSCSSGWGTWKNKWAVYEENYDIVNEIKKEPKLYERLGIWGNDLEMMLSGSVLGRCDAWDVFWSLNIIKREGYCLSPYKQLIHNIGFDGSGLHSGQGRQYDDKNLENEYKDVFIFPSKIESTKECETEFQFLFGGQRGLKKWESYRKLLGNWIKMKQKGKEIIVNKEWGNSIAVWGKGEIFDILLDEIKDKINVAYIIESSPTLYEYKGIPIIPINKIPESINNIIVIPYFDIDIIECKVKKIRPDLKLWGINELI